jgi:hypothetical protein
LTGTLAAHAVNPSFALTTPLATRCFLSFSVTLLECEVLTVKLDVLVAEPSGVVTLIGPVVAPAGTVAVILVDGATLNVVAETPLKVTAVAPVKFVPVIVTIVPTGPKVGVNDVIVGTPVLVTVNLWELQAVPPGVVTQIFPVVAPLGTVAVIWVDEPPEKVVADVPPNVTAVAPVRVVPVIVTIVPIGPEVGVNEVIVGLVGGAAEEGGAMAIAATMITARIAARSRAAGIMAGRLIGIPSLFHAIHTPALSTPVNRQVA